MNDEMEISDVIQGDDEEMFRPETDEEISKNTQDLSDIERKRKVLIKKRSDLFANEIGIGLLM
jgi:hypothetical protein